MPPGLFSGFPGGSSLGLQLSGVLLGGACVALYAYVRKQRAYLREHLLEAGANDALLPNGHTRSHYTPSAKTDGRAQPLVSARTPLASVRTAQAAPVFSHRLSPTETAFVGDRTESPAAWPSNPRPTRSGHSAGEPSPLRAWLDNREMPLLRPPPGGAGADPSAISVVRHLADKFEASESERRGSRSRAFSLSRSPCTPYYTAQAPTRTPPRLVTPPLVPPPSGSSLGASGGPPSTSRERVMSRITGKAVWELGLKSPAGPASRRSARAKDAADSHRGRPDEKRLDL
jgi:hypothetical protein